MSRSAGSFSGCEPGEAADLRSRLRGLESQQRSWRRQLASGHRAVQEKYVAAYRDTTAVRGYEATVVPGLFQTPGFARVLLQADYVGASRALASNARALSP
ncbi:Scr1 family TA system antitoxin-like transcriptional regulator [Streptomyces niveus]|uniref:Scr1 family TA system antitoxin-like transcriptional regulator n=1 Tax=Streptomyces niveus TaxID=193462 RepID=UPI00371209DC